MKKFLFLSALFLLSACSPTQPHVIQDTQASISGPYLGSEYKGNYVWGGAMNLAWTELNDNLIKEKTQLKTDDKTAVEMVKQLNDPIFTKTDLDEASYYIKSGYGQQTVATINQESKAKFPSKSFADLEMDLDPKDLIAYAYFLKEVEYLTPFETSDLNFLGQTVNSFYAQGEQKKTVEILNYESDDKFIIRLKLKDAADQLILAKGYDMTDPQQVVSEVEKNNKKELPLLAYDDRFETPVLHLDHHRDYVELIGKYFANKGFEDYAIGQMFENIKFDMDEEGAKVENEAVITGETMSAGPPEEEPPHKNFILNKPYWVIMQRQDAQNPYFILGVKNEELMDSQSK